MERLRRILTIEDELIIRDSIVAFLEDCGFEVSQAHDGATGIETFYRIKPDVVLIDLRLPDTNGLDILSEFVSAAPDTPIIVVSGANRLSYAVQALKRGAWDYVMKPILDMEVLESAIKRALERAHLKRQNRTYSRYLEDVNLQLVQSLRQLQDDEEAGRRVQHQLLPQNNWQFGSVTFSHRLFPSTYLSGDYVDYFAIDDSRAGFYMADVSGHGAASAFITVMIRTLINEYLESCRLYGDDTILDPAKTLEKLNADLCRQNIDKYATIFYAVFDQDASRLVYSNGGQYPFPILHDGSSAVHLCQHSRPVGLFPDARFERCEIALPDRFSLVIASDGVLELLKLPSAAADQPNPLSRKSDVLRDRITGTAVSIRDIVTALGLEDRAELVDDVTLLNVSRQGKHG